jgi:SAM-dependent methyltransferase
MEGGTQEWYEQSFIYEEHVPRRVKYWAYSEALSVPSQSVFDVGCGVGNFLYWAQQSGKQVAGADFNRQSIEIAKKHLGLTDVYVGDVHSLNLQKRFDLVTLFEVLEHISDPVGTLVSLKRYISEDGHLAVSVPCYQRWPRLFDETADFPPHHLTLWTPKALKSCMEQAGYQVVSVKPKPLDVFDFGAHLKWRLKRMLIAGKPKAGASSPLVLAALPLTVTALRPLSWLMRVHPKAGGFTLVGIAKLR